MAEHDPQAFEELFAAEPNEAASPETTRWVELYQKLVAMMERQLEETRAFATSSPDAMRQYLSRKNIAILEEEIEAFRRQAGPLDQRRSRAAMNDQRSETTATPSDEKAALEEVEPDRLLDGEDENSQHLDDAEHWVKVYTELLEFKRAVLATTEKHVGTMDADASLEVQKTDLQALHAEALRFERRLVYWRGRVSALQEKADVAKG